MKALPFFTLILLISLNSSLCAADPKANWDENCVSCHGKEGKADTTMGKMLKAKDFSDPAVQASFTDAKAIESIKNGVNENGGMKMRAFGDTLTEEEIKALVAYIHTLKK